MVTIQCFMFEMLKCLIKEMPKVPKVPKMPKMLKY